jgi:hypothetical protein
VACSPGPMSSRPTSPAGRDHDDGSQPGDGAGEQFGPEPPGPDSITCPNCCPFAPETGQGYWSSGVGGYGSATPRRRAQEEAPNVAVQVPSVLLSQVQAIPEDSNRVGAQTPVVLSLPG